MLRGNNVLLTRMFEGVMQSTVTPLKEDFSPDLATFEKLLDFHVRTGATAISWPHHKGESLNLTIAERKALAEVAVKAVAGRVPISIHVSALAVEDSMELAQHAQKIGADAIIAITPYFWNPDQGCDLRLLRAPGHVGRSADDRLQLAAHAVRRGIHRRAHAAPD